MQTNGRYTLTFTDAIGSGAVVLSNQNHQIELTDAKGQMHSAKNAEILMKKQLGWSVPVDGLVYWVRGLPLANQPFSASLNEQGALSILEQQGWIIRYSEYQTVDGLPLPGRIVLTRQGLQVLMVINHWKLNAAVSPQ